MTRPPEFRGRFARFVRTLVGVWLRLAHAPTWLWGLVLLFALQLLGLQLLKTHLERQLHLHEHPGEAPCRGTGEWWGPDGTRTWYYPPDEWI